MDAKKKSPEPPSRFRAISLVLSVACALLALAVLILLQRNVDVLVPPAPTSTTTSAPAPEPEDPPEVPSSRATANINVVVVIDARMTHIEGHLTLHTTTLVVREAKEGADVVAELPPETAVELVGRRDAWTLISWKKSDSAVWMGWVLLSSAPAASSGAAAEAPGKRGTATIRGAVSLRGKPPEMKVPRKRKDADVCKDKAIPYNAVLVNDGKLRDVLVRITPGGVPGAWKAPEEHARVDQVDCMFAPRIQGVITGQTVDVANGDLTLHNVHTYKGNQTLWNQAEPKGAAPLSKEAPDEASILKLTCDVHPWMRAFVVVTDHPFFAVTGEDGAFRIEEVPAGKYALEAWHSRYGLLRRQGVTVREKESTTVDFEYTGDEPEPPENVGELQGLF